MCLMEILQLLLVFFLLLSTPLGDVQTEFQKFKCDENVIAEIRKDINITCINNKEIISMAVKFCINETLCPSSSDINTFAKKTTADNGRIALEINITSAVLHISSVQISDQRLYRFFLNSNNGYNVKDVTLQVVDPVSLTSRKAVTEIAISEKLKSEETNYTAITVVSIPILLAFAIAVVYWRKKKGAIKLPCRNPPDNIKQDFRRFLADRRDKILQSTV